MTEFESKFQGISSRDPDLIRDLKDISNNIASINFEEIKASKAGSPKYYDEGSESWKKFNGWYFNKMNRDVYNKGIIQYLFELAETRCGDRFERIFNNWRTSDWNTRKGLYHNPRAFLTKIIIFPRARDYWFNYEKTKYEDVLTAIEEVDKMISAKADATKDLDEDHKNTVKYNCKACGILTEFSSDKAASEGKCSKCNQPIFQESNAG